ncbi:Gfo/Idh/MocA family protein [Saccharopolyspora endophytica]|uniref:Gfo/Idh/MocA family oxidoreductase n=1 Tax=Saccharopolyspora endophytica TaxID=543886 RepID=A0ABS5DQ17_9PSEU|nr:Gfo/Idh/MocA family oxidoreductase [Saccharopolyspora endophytica]MBQ0928392.1 Gfo/Idh/MocA family oxidoreductase [Saccharopolyspora endophytica]
MTLNVAIIGAGAIAHDHAAALDGLSGVRVSHVISSDPSRAAAVAARAPGAVPTAEAAAVLADPAVTGVSICTATPTHAAWALRSAESGKHVHVEKPVALSLTDFDAMAEACRRARVVFMVGQTVRFQPVVAELAAAVRAGDIGTPRLLHLSWYTGHTWPGGWRAWQLDPAKSGGHPVHNGTHALDLATWLFERRPIRVFARGFPTFAADLPTPDSFHLTVRFDDGSLALIELSYGLTRSGDFLRRYVLAGERGTLAHSTEDEPALISEAAKPAPASIAGAMDRQLDHWVRLIRGEAEPIVRLDQVRATLATALAAQQSLITGQPVEVDHA